MVDVVFVDVARQRRARAGKQVGVAGGVHHDFGEDRAATFLALEDDAAHPPVLDDGLGRPGVKNEPRAGFVDHVQRGGFERFRVHRRRPGDDAVIGGGALRPIGGGGGVPRSPVGARRAEDGVLRQAVENVAGEAGDDLPPVPVGHAIDPDNQPAGRQPAEVVVALDEHGVGAQPRGGDGGRRSRRAAADHQHAGFRENRGFARRFRNAARLRLCRRPPRASGVAAEYLEPLLRADHVGEIVRHRRRLHPRRRTVRAAV